MVTSAPSGGGPVSARFSRPLAPGDYFEIEVKALSSSGSVGISTARNVKPGYGTRGLFFNGNLSDGIALKKGNFGAFLKQGMRVGVKLGREGEAVVPTFYQDGRCLGKGFVAKLAEPDAELFPVVQGQSEGDAFAISFPSPPADELREAKAPGATPFEGEWQLKRTCKGPELGEERPDPMDKPATMAVSAADEAGTFWISLRVVNRINAKATSVADASVAPFETFKMSPPASTRMMGPPGAMGAEQRLSACLQEVDAWVVSAGSLIMRGPCVELEFVPKEQGELPPVTDVTLA